MADDASQSPKIEIEHSKSFISLYANHVLFHPTAWDLKILFGQVENRSGTDVVTQDAAITIPWAQAKLALFYLRAQVEVMEMLSGKIPLRKDLLPADVRPLTPEQQTAA